jgi:hypothetical protein
MTLTELSELAKTFGWKESICDYFKKRGRFVLRAQNGCIVILKKDSQNRQLLHLQSLDHQVSFKYLCSANKPHVIGPFGKQGFNLITGRFHPWPEKIQEGPG